MSNTTKYEQLTADLKKAVEDTAPLEKTEDGGTCNFDSPTLTLPRWNHEKTEDAIQAAGCGGWYSGFWKSWVISFPTSGQGNRRSRRAEAMRDSLKAAGYESSVYYQMD